MSEDEFPPESDQPTEESSQDESSPESEDKATQQPVGSASGPSEEEAAPPPDPADVAATAEEFVGGLLEAMGMKAEITSTVDGDSAFVDVKGEELGVLIGRRGQTLDALQELARTATQRRLRSRVRLLVDVESYRARRKASLIEYAHSIAERAKERGTEIELEPMSAYERKVVHDAVSTVEGASSFSEGEEPNRKVVVRGEAPA